MGNNYCDLAGDTGKEYICFGGEMISDLTSGDTHVDLKVIDGALHDSAYLVKGDPFFRIPLDTGEHAQFHVVSGVGSTSFCSAAAGIITLTYPFAFHHVDFEAAPFDVLHPFHLGLIKC